LNTTESDGKFFHEIYGYIFQDANYILFKMDFFRRQSDLLIGIDVQQLEGEGFILGSFFSQLLAVLRREGYMSLVSVESSLLENETEADDEDFCYSSDEEEPSTNEIDVRFLQLHRSPKLITTWIETLESKRINHPGLVSTLLLFAHNCQYEPNLNLIFEVVSPQWERLLEIVLNRMKDSPNLPVVYSCSKILYYLFTKEHLPLTWKDIATLSTVLKYWSTDRAFSLSSPVSRCLPIQKELVFVLSKCKTPEHGPQLNESKDIAALRDLKSLDEAVRSDLAGLLAKI